MNDTEKKVKGFFLYFDQWESIKLLSNEQKSILLEALFVKLAGGEYEITDPAVNMAFQFIKLSHEQRVNRFNEICERRRESANKRWKTNDNMQMDANAYKSIQEDTNGCNCIQMDASDGVTKTITRTITKTNNIYIGSQAPKQTTKNFIPPTVEEVKAYIAEKGYAIDAEAFVLHYEARGWMLGKTKMKSWKAAVGTWVKNNYGNNGKQQGSLLTGNSAYKQSNLSDIVGW